MKLIEALEILKKEPSETSGTFRAFLVCGFSPLHIQTFLEAHLKLTLSDRKVEILSGLYGDFWGNLDRLESEVVDVGIAVVEWTDLDPRLSLRGLGSWNPAELPDILKNLRAKITRFVEAIGRLSQRTLLVVSLPTLPLPPVSFSAGWRASSFDLELRAVLSSASVQLGQMNNVRLLSEARLDQVSAPANRFDAKSEIASGFPYKLAHASAMAGLMARMALPASPKKGLITDLDDTLWSGILGEVGAEGIFWDLEHNSQLHGLYQRLLHALSEAGVLIAAASKNDPRVVAEALQRPDLAIPASAIFPVEAHWGPKSESVGRILKAWNIGADAAIFVDDSPMELAEVKMAHSGIECILFPKDDPQALVALLYQLRDYFGKDALSEEDEIRRESIRRSRESELAAVGNSENLDDFLSQAQAEIALNLSKEPLDPRAFELINKTNQFNLNGRRYSDAAWQGYLKRPETFLMLVSYRDKYGPLGKIAALAGRKQRRTIWLDVWVMSCRAFSRRIENRCIEELFRRYEADEIVFDFQATAKNGPLQEFLSKILGTLPASGSRLMKEDFLTVQQDKFHRVLEASNG